MPKPWKVTCSTVTDAPPELERFFDNETIAARSAKNFSRIYPHVTLWKHGENAYERVMTIE